MIYNLYARDIIPGRMYLWLGNTSPINDYTRINKVPNAQLVNPPKIDLHETFVALEVINVSHKFFDLKVLTSKGKFGYLFRWHMEGIPAQLILSPDQLL